MTTGFARGDRNWSEDVDLVALAASTLEAHDHLVQRNTGWLFHRDSEFTILPQIASVEPLPDGGVHTVTTVQVNHPVLAPDGVFEYQHATGDSLAEAIRNGFSQWVTLDFVTLLDALQPNPKSCTTLQMEFPATDRQPARKRRAVLGPVSYARSEPAAEACATDGEAHPFCPCCLLTNSYDAFRSLIESDRFCCLRLFAQRLQDGTPGADCRVNGEDWEPGAEALRLYVRTWPPGGFEFRKQLVVLQKMDG
jgi:Family of unknown function (DUF6348)